MNAAALIAFKRVHMALTFDPMTLKTQSVHLWSAVSSCVSFGAVLLSAVHDGVHKTVVAVWPWPLTPWPLNLISSSPKYSKHLCTFWYEFIQQFTSYQVHIISKDVAAWPWPFTPWPWKSFQQRRLTWWIFVKSVH